MFINLSAINIYEKKLVYLFYFFYFGSRSGIRTHNPVRAIDFKSIMYRQFHHTAKDVIEVVLGWLHVDRLSSFAPMC